MSGCLYPFLLFFSSPLCFQCYRLAPPLSPLVLPLSPITVLYGSPINLIIMAVGIVGTGLYQQKLGGTRDEAPSRDLSKDHF
jgi:hypothetical protein